MNYALKINAQSQSQAKSRVIAILETMLVVSLWLHCDVTAQEETIAYIGLRTEIAETIIAILHMGILRDGTQINAILLEIVSMSKLF